MIDLRVTGREPHGIGGDFERAIEFPRSACSILSCTRACSASRSCMSSGDKSSPSFMLISL